MPKQTVAETLRAIGSYEVWKADLIMEAAVRQKRTLDSGEKASFDEHMKRHAACEAGARCVEAWERFAAVDPWQFDHWNHHYSKTDGVVKTKHEHCRWCGNHRIADTAGQHADNCLWVEARSLVSREEGLTPPK